MTLSIRSVSVWFGPRQAVCDLSLDLARGEVMALIGPNGAGKTTLIRAIHGGCPVRSGTIRMGGDDLQRMPVELRARRIAVVPQALHLPESFSAFDTVLMGRTPYLTWLGRESEADRDIALEAMRRTDTFDLQARLIGELSGGEQQRILIARALAQRAPLLLMDEPVAYLDIKHQASILSLVREIARQDGLAVLMAMHDLTFAGQYADRIALMANGILQAIGSPSDVLRREILTTAYGLPVDILAHPEHGYPIIVPAR
jgi:iron complex transport system ATP-binding protein